MRELDIGRRPVEPSDAKAGDYVEFYAELDVLMAVSIGPGGSFSGDWSAGRNEILPIGIEIYDTGFQPLEFEDVLGFGARGRPIVGLRIRGGGGSSGGPTGLAESWRPRQHDARRLARARTVSQAGTLAAV